VSARQTKHHLAISIPVETDPEPRQIGQEGDAARRIVPAAALVDDEHVAHLEPPKDRRMGTAGCDPLENLIGSRVGLVPGNTSTRQLTSPAPGSSGFAAFVPCCQDLLDRHLEPQSSRPLHPFDNRSDVLAPPWLLDRPELGDRLAVVSQRSAARSRRGRWVLASKGADRGHRKLDF
jgi:hypothetical protein